MGSLRQRHGSGISPRALSSEAIFSVANRNPSLTDAIRQIEAALARGENMADVFSRVSRDHGIERALLTRRWVQFTPSVEGTGAPRTASRA